VNGKARFAKIPARAARAKLSATDWGVLHAIALHADKEGRAFPSMARIAEIVGIQRNNVPRSIERLEERRLLRRKRMTKPNGGWQVSHYQLVFEPLGDVICADDTPAVISNDDICHLR
jgi:RIO-like serine/threonine protein kinase